MSYTLTVGCPQCGGPLTHLKQTGNRWSDAIGAEAECPVCDLVVAIQVEMTWKVRNHKLGAPTLTKLPLAPLMRAMRCETANQLGAMIGLNRASVQRLKSDGVPIHRADEFAVLCGLHATEVWGEAFYASLTPETVDA
jgi:endogenous inhibitor of DNA gyrase (YacG/DUF329 family)